jgi:phosphoribosylanthranilate isomerase
MPKVKICGISSPEHMIVAAAAGADYLGLVFAPSRRQVTVDQAQQLVKTLRDAGYATPVVGLFVNASATAISTVVHTCGLDVVQLHGNEPYALCADLPNLPIWRAVRLAGADDETEWLASTDDRITVLVDAPVDGAFGGTGRLADWQAAATLARQRRVVLAGGLHPQNVQAAIAQVHPWGVDVSSGVERDGFKDNGLIAAFVALAKDASKEA